jgi:hypothetical protein
VSSFFAHIVVVRFSLSSIESSLFHLSMRKRVHVHHSIAGLFLSITLAALVISFHFLEHGHSSVDDCSSIVTVATFNLRSTVGVFTDQLTLRLRTLRLLALPVTLGFFTDSFTFWLGHLAMSDTMWFFTDSDTFGTIIHFTCFIRTHDLTVGFFTFDITNSILRFLARRVTSGGFTDWSTNGITFGIITLPAAFRMTLQLLQLGRIDYCYG